LASTPQEKGGQAQEEGVKNLKFLENKNEILIIFNIICLMTLFCLSNRNCHP
jgi:hypothetical protein